MAPEKKNSKDELIKDRINNFKISWSQTLRLKKGLRKDMKEKELR